MEVSTSPLSLLGLWHPLQERLKTGVTSRHHETDVSAATTKEFETKSPRIRELRRTEGPKVESRKEFMAGLFRWQVCRRFWWAA